MVIREARGGERPPFPEPALRVNTLFILPECEGRASYRDNLRVANEAISRLMEEVAATTTAATSHREGGARRTKEGKA